MILASWNVHGWVGADGRRDPVRSFEALGALGAEVVALQEVDGGDWAALAEAAGYRPLLGATEGDFGNALLLRVPLRRLAHLDLSVAGRERRAALEAEVEADGGTLRVATTHLGLRAGERRQQAARLARHLEAGRDQPTVLLGDLNDWTPWGGQLAPLVRAVGPLTRLRTFPSRRPLLPLDRAAWRGPAIAARARVVASPLVRRSSDHLPLRLELSALAP